MCRVILVLCAILLATNRIFSTNVNHSSVDATGYIYINKSCLAFYVRKIELIVFDNPSRNYSIQSILSSTASCGQGDSASLSFTANTASSSIPDVQLTFDFLSNNLEYWALDKATAKFNGKSHILLMNWSKSPNSMGFKCSNTGNIVAVDSNPRVEFVFHGLQVQPFGITDGVFAEANDCVGFMSTEIFSSLFIVFLLLGIFTYGLVMLMGIQTNDTFDDPKHKMIQLGGTAE